MAVVVSNRQNSLQGLASDLPVRDEPCAVSDRQVRDEPGAVSDLPVRDQACAGESVADFLVSFDAFAAAVRRARGVQAQSRDDALTLSQYALLQALSTRETARVRELAAEAGITASTATRILDALERRAIVERSRSRDDRRGVTVTLTGFGREKLSGQDAWLRGRQRAFYDGLPATERELISDLLVRLAGLIDELAAGPTDELGAGPTDELAAGPTDELGAGPTDEPAAGPTDELAAGPTDELAAGPTADGVPAA